jgi:hypothetical protein
MDTNYEEKNKSQIIRQDARNCFVESRSDAFEIGKIHFEFATYDTSKPKGECQTNNVNIYLDVSEFYGLAHTVLHGHIHLTMSQYKKIMKEIEEYKSANNNQLNDEMKEKQAQVNKPLFQSLGGTPADKLRQYGRERKDGLSLSRSISLSVGGKVDYLLCAESGPGQTDSKGLIVPQYGNKPEQRVSVAMNWQAVNEIMMMTKIHYEAWLAAKYMAETFGVSKAPKNPPLVNSGNQSGDGGGTTNTDTNDIRMF